MMIAMYIGWLSANTASAIETIPINKTSIDVKEDILFTFDINPVIPNTIMMNPTIQNWNPTKNEIASRQNMNANPSIIVIIPMIIVINGNLLMEFLMLNPKNVMVIPKNSKLNPTITETKVDENIGNKMNIKPRTILKIPANFSISIISPLCKTNYLYT